MYVKELSGYNIRIGYPRQKFSFVGCPEINDTGAVASVGMIMAAKGNKYLNCLSEPPARYDEDEEEPVDVEVAAAEEYPVQDEAFEGVPAAEENVETATATEGEEEKKEPGRWAKILEKDEERRKQREAARQKKEEEKAKKRPIIVWKNPFDAFTKKVTDLFSPASRDGGSAYHGLYLVTDAGFLKRFLNVLLHGHRGSKKR